MALLDSYAWGPFPILEVNIRNVEEKILPNVEYTINFHRIEQIQSILLDECNRLYNENKSQCPDISDSYWVLYNANLNRDEGKPDIQMHWFFEKGELKTDVPYVKSKFPKINEKGFFLRPEIHFNILLNEGKALIAYYFGKRYARCLEYDLICVDDKYSISNMVDVWVS